MGVKPANLVAEFYYKGLVWRRQGKKKQPPQVERSFQLMNGVTTSSGRGDEGGERPPGKSDGWFYYTGRKGKRQEEKKLVESWAESWRKAGGKLVEFYTKIFP